MTNESAGTPVVCDMSDSPDTGAQRLAEYGRLFDAAFVARERTPAGGIRWVLRADPGIGAWAGDLAARENACCAFMTNTVTVVGEHVLWEASVIDDPSARAVLDVLFELPHRLWTSPEAVYREWDTLSLPILTHDGALTRPATQPETLTESGSDAGNGQEDADPHARDAPRQARRLSFSSCPEVATGRRGDRLGRRRAPC